MRGLEQRMRSPPEGTLRRQRIGCFYLGYGPTHLVEPDFAAAQPQQQPLLKITTLTQQKGGHARRFGGLRIDNLCGTTR